MVSRQRLPLRLARREVWRRPGRTALVALLVAVPIAAMVIAVVLIRTDRSTTPLEQWERNNGQADALYFGFTPAREDVSASADADTEHRTDQPSDTAFDVDLPRGTRAVTVASSWSRVRTAEGRRADLDLRDLPLLDPITTGIHDLVRGRAATTDGEIVLGADLARRLHVTVGDDLVLDRPSVTYHVVGLVEPVGCLSCPAALVAPGTLASFPSQSTPDQVQLLDLPDDMTGTDIRALAESTPMATRYQVEHPETLSSSYGDSDASKPIRWSLVLGALALTVVGIVISAAFAVGARRQLVTLGQLSASGASPSTVRATLVLQGTVTGMVGAAAGLATAAVALLLGRGLVERFLDERIDTYAVHPLDVALVVLIGMAAATVAALIPARSAARIPTLAALAGRRPLHPVPGRLIGWGFVAFLSGLGLLGLAAVGSRSGQSGDVWVYVAILGGVAELLGACALAPAIVARLEPLASRLRGPWRLGARSLARHRSRTGAVVSAVAAAGALAVASAALVLGEEARNGIEVDIPDDVVVVREVTRSPEAAYEHSTPATDGIRAELRSILPGSEEVTLRSTVPSTGGAEEQPQVASWSIQAPGAPEQLGVGRDTVMVADDAVLDLLRASSDVRDALAEVGIVVTTREESGPVEVVLPDGRRWPAVQLPSRYTMGHLSSLLISPERAWELGLSIAPVASAFRSDSALTADQRDELDDLQYDLATGEHFSELRWSMPRSGPTPFQVELLLSGLTLVFSLFVVGLSLALAAAESKDERDILTIAGAPPSTLARSAGAQAWLLAAIGAAMAIPVGFLPVVVFARAQSTGQWATEFPLVFPTRTVLALLVLVPTLVAAVAWAGSGSAQRLRPVRVSTATFE